jgi:hypothetical protein
VESVLVPPEHEKCCIDILCPRSTIMHYRTHISHKMKKHKFGVTCPDTLFVVSLPAHPRIKNGVSTFGTPDA